MHVEACTWRQAAMKHSACVPQSSKPGPRRGWVREIMVALWESAGLLGMARVILRAGCDV